jgi:hypothetical protein
MKAVCIKKTSQFANPGPGCDFIETGTAPDVPTLCLNQVSQFETDDPPPRPTRPEK